MTLNMSSNQNFKKMSNLHYILISWVNYFMGKQFQANSQIFPARKPKNQGIPGEQVFLRQFIEQIKCIFCAYQSNITCQANT